MKYDSSLWFFAVIGIILIVMIVKNLIEFFKNLSMIISGVKQCKTPVTAEIVARDSKMLDDGDGGGEEAYSYLYQFTFNGNVYRVPSSLWTVVHFPVGYRQTIYIDANNPNHIFQKGVILLNAFVNLFVCLLIVVLFAVELPPILYMMKAVFLS